MLFGNVSGPLSTTVGDFWQMVWESESTLVVMLTVLTETGRAKCHQYWPKVGSAGLKATSSLTVITNSEQSFGHYVQRDMVLKVRRSFSCSNLVLSIFINLIYLTSLYIKSRLLLAYFYKPKWFF